MTSAPPPPAPLAGAAKIVKAEVTGIAALVLSSPGLAAVRLQVPAAMMVSIWPLTVQILVEFEVYSGNLLLEICALVDRLARFTGPSPTCLVKPEISKVISCSAWVITAFKVSKLKV